MQKQVGSHKDSGEDDHQVVKRVHDHRRKDTVAIFEVNVRKEEAADALNKNVDNSAVQNAEDDRADDNGVDKLTIVPGKERLSPRDYSAAENRIFPKRSHDAAEENGRENALLRQKLDLIDANYLPIRQVLKQIHLAGDAQNGGDTPQPQKLHGQHRQDGKNFQKPGRLFITEVPNPDVNALKKPADFNENRLHFTPPIRYEKNSPIFTLT